MNINFSELSYIAILLASVLRFVISMIYYSQGVMGKFWIRYNSVKCEELGSPTKVLTGAFLIGLIAAFTLAIIFHFTGLHDWKEGACLGFWIWIGFVATSTFSRVLFSKMSLQLFGLTTLNDLIGYIAMGAVIGALS